MTITAASMDLASYCAETRDALAAELGIPASLVDHNLDVMPSSVSYDLEPVIWHELLVLPSPDMVSAFRWDGAGWWFTVGRFDAARPMLSPWNQLSVAPDCAPWEFARAAAAVCRQRVNCRWCRKPIQLYGGVWFQRGGGGLHCPDSGTTEHAPASGIAPP